MTMKYLGAMLPIDAGILLADLNAGAVAAVITAASLPVGGLIYYARKRWDAACLEGQVAKDAQRVKALVDYERAYGPSLTRRIDDISARLVASESGERDCWEQHRRTEANLGRVTEELVAVRRDLDAIRPSKTPEGD